MSRASRVVSSPGPRYGEPGRRQGLGQRPAPARPRRSARPNPRCAATPRRPRPLSASATARRARTDLEEARRSRGPTRPASGPARCAGSSRDAYAMTSRGTRKPAVSSSTTASGLAQMGQRLLPTPRRPGRRALRQVAEDRRRTGRAAPAHRPVLHGGEVLRLVEHDMARASACAGPGRSASSINTASAADHLARLRPTARASAHRIVFCSSAVRMPSACAARKSASESSRSTSFAGSTGGQIAFTAAFTAVLRATASCTRSSGASPARSIRTSTACAIRCGSASRAAPYRMSRSSNSRTISSSSYAGRASAANRARPSAARWAWSRASARPGAAPPPSGRRP